MGKHLRYLVLMALLFQLAPAVRPPLAPGSVLASAPSAPAAEFIVTNTYDEVGGECAAECCLRQAIVAANNTPGPDTITFNIPITDTRYNGATGQWTIPLESGPLPILGDPGTIIDASSLAGCSDPKIILDANGASHGIQITGTNQSVSGLVIRNASQHGVYIWGSGAQSNTITCNYIVSNTVDGVRVGGGASLNAVGSVFGDGNLISGNGGDGIHITNGAYHNSVLSNTIGISVTGSAGWANGGWGVRLSSSAMTNTIGWSGMGNVISGNDDPSGGGVLISTNSRGNVVQHNTIGTDAAGQYAIPNYDGVVIAGSSYNTIGPDNLISGNTRDGVRIQDGSAHDNKVVGNYIGTNAGGSARISNQRYGVAIENEAYQNAIGGYLLSDGNLISGNGYEGDYLTAGAVVIRGSSHHNTLLSNSIGTTADGLSALPNGGHGVRIESDAQYNSIGLATIADCENIIAWNEGDGIHIHGEYTLYNTIWRNSIRDNSGLGINLMAGGNRGLAAPEITQYQTSSAGTTSLQARTCLTCSVRIYIDEDGEGRIYDGQVLGLDPYGNFTWQGPVSPGSAFTLMATDADGNSSEFSASAASLSLSLDDALPHVVVNKLPSDSDGPAGTNTVDFVASIVSYDPTLRENLNLELRVSSHSLGIPSVFTRSQPSDYTGGALGSTNPSPGVYRVEGFDLQPDSDYAPQWNSNIVLRFNIPHGATPGPVIAFSTITATGRTINGAVDYGAMQILQRAGEIIITNRTLLYSEYDDAQVTTFLRDLYAFAQGPPFNWSPTSVIYYVDTYTSTLANWDNTTVNYSLGQDQLNAPAYALDALIEDWMEDSPFGTYKKCSWSYGCHQVPINAPYLLIAGDDNIIPYFRRADPTGDSKFAEGQHTNTAPNQVLQALRNNNYFFTDNLYADISTLPDDFHWNEGGVDIAAGRLVGTRASHLSTFLHAGQYGPVTSNTAQAIIGSGCGTDAGDIAGYMRNYGYNVLNDLHGTDPGPRTVDDDNWSEPDLLSLMELDYQLFHHGNHAHEFIWTTPPCGGGQPGLQPGEIFLTTRAARIQANRPIFSSGGCRSGLTAAQSDPNPLSFTTSQPTIVNQLVREGASAVLASTGISQFQSWPSGWKAGAEELMCEFWVRATRAPSIGQLNLGHALYWTKRYWDGHWSVNDMEEKTGAEFVLYGVPWVTAPYRGTSSSPRTSAEASSISPVEPLGPSTYVLTSTFDASGYVTVQVDGFDLVEVPGMVMSNDSDVPVIPLAITELELPPGATLLTVQVSKENPVDLGTLNIPVIEGGVPIVGGDPGGPIPSPDIGVYPPQDAVSRTVSIGGFELARVYASPLVYDTSNGQTTIFQNLSVRITYHSSATIGLLGMGASPADLGPGHPFTATVEVINAGPGPVAVTGTLWIESDMGGVLGTLPIGEMIPPTLHPDRHPLELMWTAPISEGAYSLFAELYHDGELQGIGHSPLQVAGGRITGFAVPDSVRPGDQAPFQVTFENRRGSPFEGSASVSIYGTAGLLTTMEAPIFAEPGGQGVAEMFWNTFGVDAGTYTAAAEVVEAGEGSTYGVLQDSFDVRHSIFLPLVLRALG